MQCAATRAGRSIRSPWMRVESLCSSLKDSRNGQTLPNRRRRHLCPSPRPNPRRCVSLLFISRTRQPLLMVTRNNTRTRRARLSWLQFPWSRSSRGNERPWKHVRRGRRNATQGQEVLLNVDDAGVRGDSGDGSAYPHRARTGGHEGGVLPQVQPASALGLKRASMVVPWWSRSGQGLPPR